MDERLTEILRRYRNGLPCPTCGDSGLYWDEKTQDVESCECCDLLENILEREYGAVRDKNIVRLFRSPNTGKLDDIPF